MQETIEGHLDEAAEFYGTCNKKRRSGEPGVDWQDRWKKEQGRRRQLWTASLVEWIKERDVKNLTEMELLSKANDRELWHNMIAKVS